MHQPWCSIYSITLVGTDPSEFDVLSATPGPLAPAASREVSVRFTPATVGSKSAQLRIVSDDADEPMVDIDLAGRGVIRIFSDGFESGDTSSWSD